MPVTAAVLGIYSATSAAAIIRKAACREEGYSPQRSFLLQGSTLATRECDGRKEIYAPQGRVLAARDGDFRKGVLLITMETARCKAI